MRTISGTPEHQLVRLERPGYRRGALNTTVRRSLFAAALLCVAGPTAAIAQVAPGFGLTIEGARQGVFPGGKGGAIGGLRFSYLLKSPRDAASGLPTGKRVHSPVVFTKAVGAASPQIFSALATNENLKSVVISVPGGYMIKLTNASVSEIKQYTEVVNGYATILEDVSFTFQKIEVQDPGTQTMATDDWASPAM